MSIGSKSKHTAYPVTITYPKQAKSTIIWTKLSNQKSYSFAPYNLKYKKTRSSPQLAITKLKVRMCFYSRFLRAILFSSTIYSNFKKRNDNPFSTLFPEILNKLLDRVISVKYVGTKGSYLSSLSLLNNYTSSGCLKHIRFPQVSKHTI